MADTRALFTKLINFRPRPDQLLRLVRKLAAEGKISYLDHSTLDRMPERGFDSFDVLHTIKTGEIVGPIEPGAKAGEWKVKIVSWVDGASRRMGVVVIVVRESRLLIKTTEWEDR
jgi:hypothetical protein